MWRCPNWPAAGGNAPNEVILAAPAPTGEYTYISSKPETIWFSTPTASNCRNVSGHEVL